MANPGHLNNPPIVEALVDLRVVNETPLEEAAFEPIIPFLIEKYPKVEWRRTLRAEFTAPKHADSSAKAVTQDVGFHGLVMTNEARTWVAQFRPDGFTLSRVREYTTGDELLGEALNLWALYAETVGATAVIRIALRYINRLLLPFRAGEDFDRFLTAAIVMPGGTPQTISEFVTRAVAHREPQHPDSPISIVTQRLEPASEDAAPFVLDIDVFRTGEFKPEGASLLPILAELREVKNNLFFAFLKDEALEAYR
jgi:uncharacterized protein (TIGR04255 family)